MRGGWSSSGVQSQVCRASKVKSVSAWILRRNGFSSCIHGIAGDFSTSIRNSLISSPSGPTKGRPTDQMRARPERNLTPSGWKSSSLSCPARIVIRAPGRTEPSGSSSCDVAANAIPALANKIKNAALTYLRSVFSAASPFRAGWIFLFESSNGQFQSCPSAERRADRELRRHLWDRNHPRALCACSAPRFPT